MSTGRAPKDADYSDGYSPSLPALRCGFRSGSVSDQEHAEGLEFLDGSASAIKGEEAQLTQIQTMDHLPFPSITKMSKLPPRLLSPFSCRKLACLLESEFVSSDTRERIADVFSLARTATDHDLESVIEKWFSKFGQCWVKVLRNNAAKMPCAFVQYKV